MANSDTPRFRARGPDASYSHEAQGTGTYRVRRYRIVRQNSRFYHVLIVPTGHVRRMPSLVDMKKTRHSRICSGLL